MPTPKVFVILAVVCCLVVAITSNWLYVWPAPFLLLSGLIIRLDNSAAFKRVVKLYTALSKERIRIAWQRANITRLKVFLALTVVCCFLLVFSGNLLFAWLGPFFFLLALITVFEDSNRVKRIVVSPAGLRIVVTLESTCLLITAISFVRVFVFREQMARNLLSAELSRLINVSNDLFIADLLFIGMPGIIANICSWVIKANQENPLVVELQSTPYWKIERVANGMLMLSSIAILVTIILKDILIPLFSH